MKREEIEMRIRLIERKLAEATHPSDLRSLNATLEKLIMMQPERAEQWQHKTT